MTPETFAAIRENWHRDLSQVLAGHDPQPQGWDTPRLLPVTPTVSSDLMDQGLTREAILTAISQVTGLSKVELRSDRRARNLARPRQLACYLMREMSLASLPQIGRFLNREHTTVMHACRTVREKLDQGDPLTTSIYLDAKRELGV